MLVITRAYSPEVSGGGVQARELIRVLRDRVDFTVLTFSSSTSETVRIDGVLVYRVAIELDRPRSRIRGMLRFVWLLLRLLRKVDLAHVQGFSRKNILVTIATKLLGKRVVLTLRAGGHDDAGAVKARSPFGFWSVMKADTVVAVSEALRDAAARAGVARDRLRLVPNGVDTTRFHPASAAERLALRRLLSVPEDKTIILFVGFFSRDKGPHRLFAAWKGLAEGVRARSMLLFIGQTKLPHPEIDLTLVEEIRREGRDASPPPQFVEQTSEIEHYYRAADVFVLPSIREGCSNVLLEAMATGLPVISARLPGSTDSVISDGANGRLVPPGDVEALLTALSDMLSDPRAVVTYGVAARETACRAFSLEQVSGAYLEIYEALSALPRGSRG